MAKTSSSKNGFFDHSKAFGDFRIPSFDAASIAETQRKNIEALTQANQLAVEGMRALARRQVEIMQQAFEEASVLWRDPHPADCSRGSCREERRRREAGIRQGRREHPRIE